MSDAYHPTYFESLESSIENMILAVREVLIYWHMCHTHGDTWTEHWFGSGWADDWDNIQYIFEQVGGVVDTSYFTFDWAEAAYKELADEIIRNNEMLSCPDCGRFVWNDEGYCDVCIDEDGDPLEPDPLDESDIDRLADYLQDCQFSINPLHLWNAFENEAFPVYRDALVSYTSEVEYKIELYLKKLEECENNMQVLQLTMSAMDIPHVHGDICDDYGDNVGLSWSQVDTIRSDGIKAYFDSDEVMEFLEDDLIEFSALPYHLQQAVEKVVYT
jgi:hypothetical protein